MWYRWRRTQTKEWSIGKPVSLDRLKQHSGPSWLVAGSCPLPPVSSYFLGRPRTWENSSRLIHEQPSSELQKCLVSMAYCHMRGPYQPVKNCCMKDSSYTVEYMELLVLLTTEYNIYSVIWYKNNLICSEVGFEDCFLGENKVVV